MKNKHITGQLKLSVTAMKDISCDQHEVQAAIDTHKLGRVMYLDSQWYKGIIPISAVYGTPEEADVESILTADTIAVSKALSDFLKADEISKLGLRGEIIIKVDDTEVGKTSMAKITVNQGQISYQQTSYAWSESVTV